MMETSIDETNKTAESQWLKIYVQNVHHSRKHTRHCAFDAGMTVCKVQQPPLPQPEGVEAASADVLSTFNVLER